MVHGWMELMDAFIGFNAPAIFFGSASFKFPIYRLPIDLYRLKPRENNRP